MRTIMGFGPMITGFWVMGMRKLSAALAPPCC